MSKYRVTGTVCVNVSSDVEADSENEAISIVSSDYYDTYQEDLEAELIEDEEFRNNRGA